MHRNIYVAVLIAGSVAVGSLGYAFLTRQPVTAETQLARCKDEGRVLSAKMVEALQAKLAKPSPVAGETLAVNLLKAIFPAHLEQHLATWQGADGLAKCREWVAKGTAGIAQVTGGK